MTTAEALKASLKPRGQSVPRGLMAPVEQGAQKMRPAKPVRTSWRSFEKLGRLACLRFVEPLKIPSAGGKFIGKDNFIRQKTACDFCGTIRKTGRAFVCDFKACERANLFPLSDDHLKPHQRDELIAHGRAGAVAGLLIEHANDGVYWAEWTMLVKAGPSIRFADMRRLCGVSQSPDLAAVIER